MKLIAIGGKFALYRASSKILLQFPNNQSFLTLDIKLGSLFV